MLIHCNLLTNLSSLSAACESSNNSPIQSFGDFVKRVKSWSGRYFWQYVVKGETQDDGKSPLRRDLNDAEDEMEKIRSSTATRLTSVSA